MRSMRNRYFLFLDLLLLPLAAYTSLVLRLEQLDLGPYWVGFYVLAFFATILVPVGFKQAGLYSRYWRYASVGELFRLVVTVTVTTLISGAVGIFLIYTFTQRFLLPRSVPFIFLMIALTVTAAPRMAVRLTTRYQQKQRYKRQQHSRTPKPVLVMGAGDAGIMILRELQMNPQLGMEVVGLLDDDPNKHNVLIHGVPVLGGREALPHAVKFYDIKRVIIAMPTAPGKVIREVVKLCEKSAVETRIIPGIYEILDGTVNVNQLREVHIEDLLRRNPIQTDTEAIQKLTRAKRVLVTGAGGSIGSELCRQIAQFNPAQLILLGHGENSVFHIHKELERHFPKLRMTALIADIRDRDRLEFVYQRHQPEIIFHAAAHKHVPLMEANPCEAITNNVLGTRNLVELAAQHSVPHFVMISTDKAVNPTSVMGASKRCAERIVHQTALQAGLPYVVVRFGNVLGSNGSVVPIFKRQIANGGPITVTHPDMRRFFMTIPEAVQLVLQAAALGKGGEIFLLDMGEPVRIVDLATDLIELSGLRPHEDIEIVFTGMRPGEKLFEELFIEGESYQITKHEKIFVVQNASQPSIDDQLNQAIDGLIQAALRNEAENIRLLLKEVVPEYILEMQPDESPDKAQMSREQPAALDVPVTNELPVRIVKALPSTNGTGSQA